MHIPIIPGRARSFSQVKGKSSIKTSAKFGTMHRISAEVRIIHSFILKHTMRVPQGSHALLSGISTGHVQL